MANKRMVANTVVGTDDFLDLPLTAQALYFHLLRSADDEGIIASARSTARMIGASKEDMSELISSGFILEHESGAVVVTHWRLHNSIAPSKKKESDFREVVRDLYITETGLLTFEKEGNTPIDEKSYQHYNVNNFKNVENSVENSEMCSDGEGATSQPLFNEQNAEEADTEASKPLAAQGGGNLQKNGGNLQKNGGKKQESGCIEQNRTEQNRLEQNRLEQNRPEEIRTEQSARGIAGLLSEDTRRDIFTRYVNPTKLCSQVTDDAVKAYGDEWPTKILDPMRYIVYMADKVYRWERRKA